MFAHLLQSGGFTAVFQLTSIAIGLLSASVILWRDPSLARKTSKMSLALILSIPWALGIFGWVVGYWLMLQQISEAQ